MKVYQIKESTLYLIRSAYIEIITAEKVILQIKRHDSTLMVFQEHFSYSMSAQIEPKEQKIYPFYLKMFKF